MPASYAFQIPLSVALAGNASGNLAYAVPQNAVFHLNGYQWKSTAGFQITSFGDNTGLQFTTATQNAGIDSDMLPVKTTPNDFMFDLPQTIDFRGGYQVIIGVKDTSGSSNTVQVLLYGVIDYPTA